MHEEKKNLTFLFRVNFTIAEAITSEKCTCLCATVITSWLPCSTSNMEVRLQYCGIQAVHGLSGMYDASLHITGQQAMLGGPGYSADSVERNKW